MWWTADTNSAIAAPSSNTSVESANSAPVKYLTFDTDCGGLNNIRMEFEFAVALARVLGRTLVLPEKAPWYLIDWGNIQVGPRPQGQQTSDYGDFWDLDSIRAGGVPVLTMEKFSSLPG